MSERSEWFEVAPCAYVRRRGPASPRRDMIERDVEELVREAMKPKRTTKREE